MNNKGFTLVELIATIALLAVISVISFVSINGVIENNKVSNCEDLVNNIKSVSKEYFSDYRYKLSEINKHYKLSDYEYAISFQELLSKEYLTSAPKNPFSNDEVLNTMTNYAKVKLKTDYTVDTIEVVKIINGSFQQIDCENGW